MTKSTHSDKKIITEARGPLWLVTINRPEVRNCVDGETALALEQAFREFEADDSLSIAILSGAGGHFCAGADLKAISSGDADKSNRITENGSGPMGPTRMQLTKPVIAAVSGYCVAGGLELALWCDMRVADESAVFGVFCRRFGVPLIDGGTVRLPRLIGASHAMDMILTGRPVEANEAKQMGLANRLVPTGTALDAAIELATQITAFPQTCLRGDRRSAHEQWAFSETVSMHNEFQYGLATLQSGETLAGASAFTGGKGRHGEFTTNNDSGE